MSLYVITYIELCCLETLGFIFFLYIYICLFNQTQVHLDVKCRMLIEVQLLYAEDHLSITVVFMAI